MTANGASFATLATFASEMEGQMIVNVLRERGIAATAFASHVLPGALDSVRVVVDQDSLSMARSILSEQEDRQSDEPLDIEDDPFPKHALTNDAESPGVQPWLTRFGILTLLYGNLFAIVGIIIYWSAGGRNVESVVSLVVSALFVTGILSTRKYLRS
ncbi:MAG: hypothetical protein NTU79_04410 [Planctomycetota bacterium]|nr:hypothetical protein [Planctomycetota bacterium]